MKKSFLWLWFGLVLTGLTVPCATHSEDAIPSPGVVSDLSLYATFQAPDVRFEKKNNGIVMDQLTGLEWLAGPDRDTSWKEAREWVESLQAGGQGWRLPTRKEIRSLYVKDAEEGKLNPLFRTRGHYVWTGEKVGPSHAWGFCFDIGDEFWPRCNYSLAARAFAVRVQEEER
jgi:hypothetical protein